jgi:hypothetical protein
MHEGPFLSDYDTGEHTGFAGQSEHWIVPEVAIGEVSEDTDEPMPQDTTVMALGSMEITIPDDRGGDDPLEEGVLPQTSTPADSEVVPDQPVPPTDAGGGSTGGRRGEGEKSGAPPGSYSSHPRTQRYGQYGSSLQGTGTEGCPLACRR